MAQRKFFSFQNYAVGLVSTFVITGLLFEGFGTALIIFLCPISAIMVWPLVVPVVGFIIMTLVDALFGREKRKASGMPEFVKERVLKEMVTARTASSRSAALKHYLRQAAAKGIDRGVMVSSLLKNGWSELEINDALGEVSAAREP